MSSFTYQEIDLDRKSVIRIGNVKVRMALKKRGGLDRTSLLFEAPKEVTIIRREKLEEHHGQSEAEKTTL